MLICSHFILYHTSCSFLCMIYLNGFFFIDISVYNLYLKTDNERYNLLFDKCNSDHVIWNQAIYNFAVSSKHLSCFKGTLQDNRQQKIITKIKHFFNAECWKLTQENCNLKVRCVNVIMSDPFSNWQDTYCIL